MTPDERRISLEAARSALRTDDPQTLIKALASLPHDGEKATELRAQIAARLSVTYAKGGRNSSQARTAPTGQVGSSIGKHGTVTVKNGGPDPLLRTTARGGAPEVTLNADHPIFRFLTRNGTLDDAATLLLLGWATLELEAGSPRRLEIIRDMMADWSRALAHIARSRESGE